MRFLVRTGLATGMIVMVLVLASAFWAEYSARGSCESVGGSEASSRRADDGTDTIVDEALPGYQIGEKHSIFIDASPARVFDSLERDTRDEHPVLRMFDLLKAFGAGGASSLEEAEMPVLDWLREGDEILEEPGREVVVVNDDTGAVSLRVEPERSGSRLTTETRLKFDDKDSCRSFGRYWGVIYPGSSLHRVYLVETVRHRVEAAPSPGHGSNMPFREGQGSEEAVGGPEEGKPLWSS